MNNNMKYVGFDVSKDKISVAIAESGRESARFYGNIINNEASIKKLLMKLGEKSQLKVCYEAGPSGYSIYRQLQRLGISCSVIAPSLIPVKKGDHVKTDRKDALKLAQLFRAGELTEIWVPKEEDEMLRDLVRAREDTMQNLIRAKHRLLKFLSRYGITAPGETKNWSSRYWKWLRTVRFEDPAREMVLEEYIATIEEIESRLRRLEAEIHRIAEDSVHSQLIKALQSLKGVGEIAAATIASEVGFFMRFDKPTQLMSYGGVVPSEYSSGDRVSRGSITKSGNSHLRRIIVECSWSYRYKPKLSRDLQKRQEGQPLSIQQKSWQAQMRLHGKYKRMLSKGKNKNKVITSIARELLGFIWSIACEVEMEQLQLREAA